MKRRENAGRLGKEEHRDNKEVRFERRKEILPYTDEKQCN